MLRADLLNIKRAPGQLVLRDLRERVRLLLLSHGVGLLLAGKRPPLGSSARQLLHTVRSTVLLDAFLLLDLDEGSQLQLLLLNVSRVVEHKLLLRPGVVSRLLLSQVLARRLFIREYHEGFIVRHTGLLVQRGPLDLDIVQLPNQLWL